MIAGGSIEQRHVWKTRRYRPMAEINVTPFVDVMLVLLIVFMVTAPLLTVGVQVDLPKTKASAVPGADEPLAITVDAAGTVYLQDTEVPLDVREADGYAEFTLKADEKATFVMDEAVEPFVLGQSLVHAQHEHFRERCRGLSLRLQADLQIGLGPADRLFGVLFGLARGAVMVALLYLPFYLLTGEEERNEWCGNCVTKPYVEMTATYMAELLPQSVTDSVREETQKKIDRQIKDAAKEKLDELDEYTDEQQEKIYDAIEEHTGYEVESREDMEELIEEELDSKFLEENKKTIENLKNGQSGGTSDKQYENEDAAEKSYEEEYDDSKYYNDWEKPE